MKSAIESLKNDLVIEGNRVSFNKEISNYAKVKAILENLGGLWVGGKAQYFGFAYDVQESIDEVIKSGKMPKKNPNAFFPTPQSMVLEMINIAELAFGYHVSPKRFLEPSAGEGGIIDKVKYFYDLTVASRDKEDAVSCEFDCVEIMPYSAQQLRDKGYNVQECDFLDYENGKYDFILMNPPFSFKGDSRLYMAHIMHAYKMLAPCGVLVAVAPTGFATNDTKRDIEFRDLIAKVGNVYKNDKGSFKDVGTNIDTVLIELHEGNGWREQEYSGQDSYHEWNFLMQLVNNNEMYKKLSTTRPTDISFSDIVTETIEGCEREYNFLPTSKKSKFESIVKKYYFEIREDEVGQDEGDYDTARLQVQKEIASSGGNLLDFI